MVIATLTMVLAVPEAAPAAATAVATSSYAAEVLADRPIAYWRLGETAGALVDATGSGHDGTATSGTSRAVPGALASDTDGAVAFDGSTGRVTVPDAAALDLNGSFTIEFWARRQFQANTWPGILSKGQSWTADGYLIWHTAAGALRFKRNGVSVATPDGALTDASFRHFAVTYDGTTLRWYVEGAMVASAAMAYPLNASTLPFLLGQGDEAGAVALDEVALYDSALPATRLAAHRQAAATTTTSTSTSTTSTSTTTTPSTTTTSTTSTSTTSTSTTSTSTTSTSTVPSTTTTSATTTTTAPSTGGSYRSTVMADAPVGYWRLGETSGPAADLASTPHPGTYGGGVTRGSAGALVGDADGAVGFDGSTGAVAIADGSALQLNGPFSIEFWARSSAFVNTWPGVLGKGTSWTADGYLIWYDANGVLRFKRNGVSLATPAGALSTTRFEHYVLTYDGTTARWYVGGSPVASMAVKYPANASTAALRLGQGDEAGAVVLDELAIYDKALTASRIASHRAAGVGPAPAAPPAPTGVTAVPGNGKAWVDWTRPVGGTPVTGYTVTATPGGATVDVAGTTDNAVVTGLANTTSYTFTVVAKGDGTASSPSAASSPVRPTADPMVAAAGDIACAPTSSAFGGGDPRECQMRATADLVRRFSPAALLPLGDLQYDVGSPEQYAGSYGPIWNSFGPSVAVHPIPGNHDYENTESNPDAIASGYFGLFGATANPAGLTAPNGQPAGYYSFDLAGWHLVALNSQCAVVGGCGVGSPEETWLRADLAANSAKCTLGYAHHPRWSNGPHGSPSLFAPFWNAFVGDRADVFLAGHDHGYQRFVPQDEVGKVSDLGLREFVVGTGGEDLTTFAPPLLPTNAYVQGSDFGILLLTLHASSYDWYFVSTSGAVLDSGTTLCHGPAPAPPPPTRYSATVLADGPLGYWRLGETTGAAADSSGAGRSGIVEGGVIRGVAGALVGDVDPAIGFDGSTGRVRIEDGTALRLNGPFTVEFWARKRSFVGSWPGILGKGPSWTADGYLIWYDANGALRFKRNGVSLATPNGALTSTGFNHFAVTYDGTTLRWYVNGALASSAARTFPASATSEPLILGQGDNPGAVDLDEVAVYGKALPAATVAAHQQAGR